MSLGRSEALQVVDDLHLNVLADGYEELIGRTSVEQERLCQLLTT